MATFKWNWNNESIFAFSRKVNTQDTDINLVAETLEINECLKSTEAVNYFTTLWYRCVKNCNWRLFQSIWGVWYLWYRHFKQLQTNILHDCDECFASQ